MDQNDSGVHVATVFRTWMVDVRYYFTGELPKDWDNMKGWEQEAWLKVNGVKASETFKEYVGIDDGNWVTPEQAEQHVSN